MKRFNLFGLLFCASFFLGSVAAHAAGNSSVANIHAGNWRVSGSLNFTHQEVYSSSYDTLTFSPGVQYFLIDKLAVGASMGLTHVFGGSAYTDLTVGPEVTYYFAELGQWAFFADESVLYSHTSVAGYSSEGLWNNTLGLGAHYFITPSVSFGPAVYWLQYFNNPYPYSHASLSTVAQFAIYL
jgi:hypothetical protein